MKKNNICTHKTYQQKEEMQTNKLQSQILVWSVKLNNFEPHDRNTVEHSFEFDGWWYRYDEDGDIFVYSTDQSAHPDICMSVPVTGTDRVKAGCHAFTCRGGGFGGAGRWQQYSILSRCLTYTTRKPVKMKLARAESRANSSKRHHPFSRYNYDWLQ